jgi:hypothetical protein
MRRVVAGLALVALAGCGSTVQVSGTAAVPGAMPAGDLGTTGGGSVVSTPSQSGATAGTTGAVTAGTTGVRGAGGTSTGGPQVGTSTGTSGSSGPLVPTGRIPGRHKGVTDTTVKLGFLYLASAGTVVGAFGIKGYSQGDELGEVRALVAAQNAAGGVAGRRIELVPHDLGGIDESAREAACTFFTQDSPVFMVLSALAHSDTINACLAKADVGYTSDYVAPPDRLMRGYGPIYAPDDISAERYAALIARSMLSGGLVKRGDKVGVYRQDTPDYARLTKQVLRPILEQAGVQVVAEESYDPNNSAEAGNSASVVFRLRGAGVTHVVSYESPLLLMTAADSQGWYPFWMVSSRAGGAFLEGAAPARELANSGGPGWMPVVDIGAGHLKGYVSTEEKRCLATLAKAGYSYSGTPRYVGQMLCGELYHLVRVVERSAELSTNGFRAAAESLPPYPSPLTFSMSFAGGRHDGAAGYRINRYSTTSSCYGYVSPLQPVPTS